MSGSLKNFEDFCNNIRESQFIVFQMVIKDARQNCERSVEREFVNSCRKFLKQNRILTEKQVDALQRIPWRYEFAEQWEEMDFWDYIGD